jgi:hypothetical protein
LSRILGPSRAAEVISRIAVKLPFAFVGVGSSRDFKHMFIRIA